MGRSANVDVLGEEGSDGDVDASKSLARHFKDVESLEADRCSEQIQAPSLIEGATGDYFLKCES